MTLRRLFDRRRSQGWLVLLAVLIIVLSTPASAASATLRVCASGCPYSTITDALNAAEDGDTIAVGPGSYAGGFAIAKPVSLRGEGASRTTITGGSPVISVASGVSAVIRGVTVTGASAFADAAIENRGTLEVKSSRVTGNANLRGISNYYLSSLAVIDSSVSENGIGIYNGSDSVVSIRNSEINGNLVGVYNDYPNITGGTIMITNTSISDSELYGVDSVLFGHITLTGSTVTRSGSRGILAVASDMAITNSTISDNAGGGIYNDSAGGIFLIQSPITLTNSVVSGNHASFGGGIYSEWEVTAKNSIIRNNTADSIGGGILVEDSLTLVNSRVTHNVAGRDGGGIWITASSPLTVVNSRIRENTPNDCVKATFGQPSVPC